MITKQQYLILALFDENKPKVFNKEDLTLEMQLESIVEKGNNENAYHTIINTMPLGFLKRHDVEIFHERGKKKWITQENGYTTTLKGKEAMKIFEKNKPIDSQIIRNKTTQIINIKGDNYGNIGQTQSGSLEQYSKNDNIKNITKAKSQKSFWQKISHFIISNIGKIILGLIIAYLIYYFGWN